MCNNGGIFTNCIMLSLVTAAEDEYSRDAGPASRCVPRLCCCADDLANTPQSLAFKSWIVSHPLKTNRHLGIPVMLRWGLQLYSSAVTAKEQAPNKCVLKIKATV